MIDFSEVFAKGEKPISCAKCGERTDIAKDISHTQAETEAHQCLSSECQNEFVVQHDPDFDNDSLLGVSAKNTTLWNRGEE